MRWRGKLLFAMIVYAAGFLTAIYAIAPSDLQAAGSRNGPSGWHQDQTAERAGAETPAWAASARVGMSRAVSFAEEQALRLAETIKIRMAQRTLDTREE